MRQRDYLSCFCPRQSRSYEAPSRSIDGHFIRGNPEKSQAQRDVRLTLSTNWGLTVILRQFWSYGSILNDPPSHVPAQSPGAQEIFSLARLPVSDEQRGQAPRRPDIDDIANVCNFFPCVLIGASSREWRDAHR